MRLYRLKNKVTEGAEARVLNIYHARIGKKVIFRQSIALKVACADLGT
jgi:hypothetical protein